MYGSGNVVDSTLTAYRGVYQMNSTGMVEIKRSALIPIDGGAVTEGGTMNIRDSVIINLNGGRGVFVDSYRGPAHVLIDGSTILAHLARPERRSTPDGIKTITRNHQFQGQQLDHLRAGLRHRLSRVLRRGHP